MKVEKDPSFKLIHCRDFVMEPLIMITARRQRLFLCLKLFLT